MVIWKEINVRTNGELAGVVVTWGACACGAGAVRWFGSGGRPTGTNVVVKVRKGSGGVAGNVVRWCVWCLAQVNGIKGQGNRKAMVQCNVYTWYVMQTRFSMNPTRTGIT